MVKNISFNKKAFFITIFTGYSLMFSLAFSIAEKPLLDQKKLEKQKKYLNGGSLEYVSFHARHKENSNRMITRRGIITRKPGARATILICHGFMCDKFDMQFLRLLFRDYNTMTFDFRAHGELTEGQCCSFGKDEALDVIGAVNFIKADPELKKVPLFVYGPSMGGVASIMAQSMDNTLFAGMILDCPFDSTEKLIGRSVDKLKFNIFGYEFTMPCRTFFEKYAYHPYVQSFLKTALKMIAQMDATQVNTCMARVNPAEAIKKITIPVFIFVCKKDEKAPVAAVRSLYHNAPGYKRLRVTDGKGHFGSIFQDPERYERDINKIINKVLENKIANSKLQKIIED